MNSLLNSLSDLYYPTNTMECVFQVCVCSAGFLIFLHHFKETVRVTTGQRRGTGHSRAVATYIISVWLIHYGSAKSNL